MADSSNITISEERLNALFDQAEIKLNEIKERHKREIDAYIEDLRQKDIRTLQDEMNHKQ